MTTDKKSTSIRCQVCKKKLGMMPFTCKCEQLLCISHLPPHEHICTYDFKKEGKILIQKQMDSERIRATSFERIE